MMIEVPMEMLGLTNPTGIKFQFKWADSESKITTMEQFYTEGDIAPLGRMNYTFQNCLDPEKAEQFVPSTPATEQETSDAPATDAPATEQGTEAEQGGCKSTVSTAAFLIALAFVPCFVFKKKKD